MALYIPGMTLPPKDGRTRRMCFTQRDGQPVIVVETAFCYDDRRVAVYPVLEVPEHGRLIDADTVVTIQTFDEQREEWDLACVTVAEALDKWSDEGCPPTIIPADGEAADNA